MTYLAKPKLHHPDLPKNSLGLTRRDYEGADLDAVRGLRPRFDQRRDHPGVLGARDPAAPRGEALGIGARPRRRPTSSTSRTASTACTAACLGAHRRQPRQPRAHLPRRLGRRRLGLHRHRAVRARDAPRREHDLHRREQRRVRPHKGQFSATADRGSKAKRGAINTDEGIDLVLMALQLGADLRRAQLLRRQGPARAAHQGRAHPRGRRVPRRDLAVRRVQQPRGLDEELRLRARAQRGGEQPRRHHRAQGNHDRVRAGAVQQSSSTTARRSCFASSSPTTMLPTASPR
jgi:hypothetical protein